MCGGFPLLFDFFSNTFSDYSILINDQCSILCIAYFLDRLHRSIMPFCIIDRSIPVISYRSKSLPVCQFFLIYPFPIIKINMVTSGYINPSLTVSHCVLNKNGSHLSCNRLSLHRANYLPCVEAIGACRDSKACVCRHI